MKKQLLTIFVLLSMVLPMFAAVDGKFTYSYPGVDELPYNLGYQYSVYDLKESDIEGWRVMELEAPVTLTYNITSEEDKTVEVVFDPSYLELVDIVIPGKVIDSDTKTEYTVTAIGKMAFDDCPKIQSVIMSDSITRIEDYAFNMCENKVLHHLGYVKFSKNLTHIGNYAFRNCHNLTTGHYTEGNQWPLVVADFVRNVDYPFYGYGARQSGLENYLLLPAKVDYIGKHAFEGCHFVNIIENGGRFEYGLSKVKIPNPSCVIDEYAFAGCHFLELVTIGEELTSNGLKDPTPAVEKKGRIGDYAFADCNLMRLDIPSSIESIGEYAFSNCFHRSRAHTPKDNTGRIYFDNLKWFYPRSLFDNYDSWWANWNIGFSDKDREVKTLKYLDAWHTNTLTIYSDNTKIGVNAFANNPLLEKVIINGTAGEIGDALFKNCSSLKKITLPENMTVLNKSMFMNCEALDSVYLPNSIAEIGDSAFYACNNLTIIELPSNLKKINPYTFYGCEWLSLADLPEELTTIGNNAFQGCRNITSITIPENVETIGDYAFADCYRHQFIRRNDIPKMYYGLTDVTIGNGVKTIGAHAFDGCHHLGQINFGENVTEIGDYAFLNCMACPEEDCDRPNNEVTLPGSLSTMGVGAFQGCTNLPAVTLLNEEMTSLPDFAFAYCSNLSSVENLSYITSANKNVFLGCYNLQDFGSLLDGEEDEVTEDGIIYNHDKTEVISALPNITKADLSETNVVRIHDGAFANCGALAEVIFPSTLEEIGSRAFENCVSLEYAELINVKMGEFVYAGCTGIGQVDISEDFTQDINDNWFAGCYNMTGISVHPDNAVYSSYYDELLLDKEETTLLRAPSGCSYIDDLPETVTKIGEYACSNCINLSEVCIPETVTHIGAHAFENCSYYSERYNNWDGIRYVMFLNPAISIGEYAFNGCESLRFVEWDGVASPGDMGSIGAHAFNGCDGLEIDGENFSEAVIDTLEPYAFANFPGVTKLTLPPTLQTIGDHAFENCELLTSVDFPEGLKKIGNSAFKSSGLETLSLTDNIEEIGDSAFMNCTKVMELKLPENLKKINPYTFYKCFSGGQFDNEPSENFNLSIEIPDNVESIGDYAFYGCVANTNKKVGPTNQLYSNYHNYYLYGLSSVKIGEGVKTIGAHAFDGCTHLLEVNMGNTVTSIGDYAFNDCFKDTFDGVRKVEVILYGTYEKPLETFPIVWQLDDYTPQAVTLPESLSSLGEGVFNGCKELPSINFPASVVDIPARAFNGCEKISSIDLPDGVKTIGEVAFGGCKGVQTISIPASLEKGSRVFVDCDSAYNVTYHAEMPKAFDEAFFSPKVYSSKAAVAYTPNSKLENVKGITPWALFYKIIAKDDTLVHLERVLEEKNDLRFRVLANKPVPYCEVAGPAKELKDTLVSYNVPEYVKNIDPESPYYGMDYKVIRIGNDAFENNMTLVGIDIPSTVFDIGQEAFNGCKNLLEINLPSSITNMGERAFANCYALTYFEIPPLVTRLNNEVLKDCRGLYSIKMHENIEELGAGSLMDCRHLRQLEGAENWNLRLIDDYALKNCIELEDINIPEGVEKIGKEAMYYCQKLNTTSLPTTLLELGENAFDDCEVLHTIKVYTEIPPKMIGERHLTDQSCKIYVQAKTLDQYKELWKVHEHRIEPGIIVTQPLSNEMPEYVSGNTIKIKSAMPLGGQTMTWTTSNSVVATPDTKHDGTLILKGVGPTHIKVETDIQFYHECDLDVFPQVADANWDSKFDIADAVNIANYALENSGVLNNWWKNDRTDFTSQAEWLRFYTVGADVNKDRFISIADASAAMKKVLELTPEQSVKQRAAAGNISDSNDMDALLVGSATESSNNHWFVPVGLMNSREYVAMEANISVPEGMKLEDVKAGARAAGHLLSTRRIDDRTIRVVLFDLNNSSFADNNLPLIELNVKGKNVGSQDIRISDIIVSDLSSTSYHLGSGMGYDPTVVRNPISGDNVIYSTDEGLVIGQAADKKIIVCTLDGKVIKSFTGASDNELVPLGKGIYIVSIDGNSTKITVK